jgi:transcriptional regulator with XRE-family HTH domain
MREGAIMENSNQLRKLRKATRLKLSIEYVARFYRGGVSKQWLSQLEKAQTVSATVELDYRAALSAAITARREATQILDRAAGKLTFLRRRLAPSATV